jgi:hypothetical protein
VWTVVVDGLARPQPSQQRQRFAGTRTALADRHLARAEFWGTRPHADPEHHPSARRAVDVGHLLREDRGGKSGTSTIDVPITAVVDIAESCASDTIVSGVGLRDEMWPPT